MNEQVTMSAFVIVASGRILMNPQPCRVGTMPCQGLGQQIQETIGRFRHARQRHPSCLPMDRDHPGERQPNLFSMALGALQIFNLGGGQGCAFPIGPIARTASTSTASRKGCHTRIKVINSKRRASFSNR